jgi:hypothetical protein
VPEPSYAAIQRIADHLAPAMRRQFLDAVRQLQGRISVEDLARAVAQGHVTPQIAETIDAHLPNALAPAIETVNRVFEAAAVATAAQVSTQFKLSARFDTTNPFMVEAAGENAARMVTGVTEETQGAIRRVISRAFTDGIDAEAAGRLIRPMVGLTERQALAVLNYHSELVDSGLTTDRVHALATRYSGKLLNQRALTIARTETMAASNAGQHASWDQAVEDGYLPPDAFKKWIVTPDDRLCRRCLVLQGQQVPMGQPFSTDRGPLDAPPLHPNCRCAMVIARRSAA